MCLAVPMKVLSLSEGMGAVEISGVKKQVDLSLLEEVDVGDYVLIHAGFALSRLDEKEAKITLKAFDELAACVKVASDAKQ